MKSNSQLMQHIVSLMSRNIDQLLLEQLGIGLAQYKILLTITEHPNIQQRTVADTLGQTEASVSRQVKLLQESQMIFVEQNALNKREHILSLTVKGQQIVDAAKKAIRKHDKKFFEGLSDKQQVQLNELLTALHRNTCYMKHPGLSDL